MTIRPFLTLILAAWLASMRSPAMELVWTRTTGQYPVDGAPIQVDTDGDGEIELLAVNRVGQVMVWDLDGADVGEGDDGVVTNLPPGQWTSSPIVVPASDGSAQYVFANGEGLIIALDPAYKRLWACQLPGKTQWSRGTPLLVGDPKSPRLIACDLSGAVSCLDNSGWKVWSHRPKDGPCRTWPRQLDDSSILVMCGSFLACLNFDGSIRWETDIGGVGTALYSIPVSSDPKLPTIFCGTESGSMVFLTSDGQITSRQSVGQEIDSSITLLNPNSKTPTIVCTGLWGNVYAFDARGKPRWIYTYQEKARAHPLVFDANGDGSDDLLVATYGQHAYLIASTGQLLDDVRVTGSMNAAPIVLPAGDDGVADVLLTTNTLLAHRFRPGKIAPEYGAVGEPDRVSITFPESGNTVASPSIVVENPEGAGLLVDVLTAQVDEIDSVCGALSASTRIEVPLPDSVKEKPSNVTVTVRALNGAVLQMKALGFPPLEPAQSETNGMRVWATPAYATFDDERRGPYAGEISTVDTTAIRIAPLYVNEIDQGACIIASSLDTPVRVRIELGMPSKGKKKPFKGTVDLFEVAMTATVNGEQVADAMLPLSPEHVVQIPAQRAAKIWLRADARGATPGDYIGRLRVLPLTDELPPMDLPFHINVPNIDLAGVEKLRLCTWDYLPNAWFPNIDGLASAELFSHGVNLFPISEFPKARYSNGQLSVDWSAFDARIAQFTGQGQVLLQLSEPRILATPAIAKSELHVQHVEYLRQLVARLTAAGFSYEDFALYPVDEPGYHYENGIDRMENAGKLIREVDPKIRIYADPVPTISRRDYERIKPWVDVWCPNMRLVTGEIVDDPRMADILGSGKPVWSYECVGQVRSISPLLYNRGAAWRAAHFGLTGIGIWTFSTTKENPWYGGRTEEGEYTLVYPGEVPIPSVRWEAVRDGIEDVAAIHLLQRLLEATEGVERLERLRLSAALELKRAFVDILERSAPAYIEMRDFKEQGHRRTWHSWNDVLIYQRHREQIAQFTLQLMAELNSTEAKSN